MPGGEFIFWRASVSSVMGKFVLINNFPGGKGPVVACSERPLQPVARWKEHDRIVEENLSYDLMGMPKQIGLMGTKRKGRRNHGNKAMDERIIVARWIRESDELFLANPYRQRWADIGAGVPSDGDPFDLGTLLHGRCSRHCGSAPTGVRPLTIHHFGGFPREL